MYAKTSTVELIAKTTLHDSFTKGFSHAITEDLIPVLAARVSHSADDKTGDDADKDARLMHYLAEHNHMSPFEHMAVTFRVSCPIFVAREMMRHRSISFNEESMRYSGKNIGTYWVPTEFRKQAVKNKQSSSGAIDDNPAAEAILTQLYAQATKAYHALIELGVAKEHARAVVPVGHMTNFYATANLRGWAHYCTLRQSPDAQVEIQEVANAISSILHNTYPSVWKVLNPS